MEKSLEIKFEEGIKYTLVEDDEKNEFRIVGKDIANNQEKVLKTFTNKDDARRFADAFANE